MKHLQQNTVFNEKQESTANFSSSVRLDRPTKQANVAIHNALIR